MYALLQKSYSTVQPRSHVNVRFPTLTLVCEVEHNLWDTSHLSKKAYFMFFFFLHKKCFKCTQLFIKAYLCCGINSLATITVSKHQMI